MSIIGIYEIRNKINNKVYVGSSVDINQRWIAHRSALRNNSHHSAHLQRSWNKYGEDSFIFAILKIVSVSILLSEEQIFIDLFKSCLIDNGYNISPIAGSCLGIKHSDEFKKQCSIRNMIRYSDPKERRKTGEASKKSWTIELRKAASERMKRTWSDPKVKKELSKLTSVGANRPDRIAKRSKHMKKRFESLEERQKALLSSPHRKRVQCVETGEVFESIAEAAKKLSVSVVKIRDSATGKRKSNGGMSFKWVNDV